MGLVKGPPPAAEAVPLAARDIDALLIDLVAPDSGVRRHAARDLGAHPDAAMALCDRLQAETSSSVRAVLLTSLIRRQSPAVAARLTTFLRSDDTPLRNAAIEALQEMPDAVAPYLQALLVDPDSDIRIFAVNIVATLRHRRAPEWLTVVIRSDAHVNVCAAAVDGLSEVGGPDALADLHALRHRFADNDFMEFAIDTAIRRIGQD
ncbi:MAG: HEAT repeat domain-containing protein [Azospirillaceae bacterium]|nr:HEAT repeat domain-containing protein [Azospirillaceae bacterium]